MRASGTFTVKAFVPTELQPNPPVSTALPVGVATMEKHFEGEVTGRSATLFTAAFDQATGVGTYVAMESFEGSLNGRAGSFNFARPQNRVTNNRWLDERSNSITLQTVAVDLTLDGIHLRSNDRDSRILRCIPLKLRHLGFRGDHLVLQLRNHLHLDGSLLFRINYPRAIAICGER